MDHVVYLDTKAKELENLKAGNKSMIIRGAMGRKLPYGRVNASDMLYFIENRGDGLVKGKAEVADVFNSEKLTKEGLTELVEKHQERLLLNAALKNSRSTLVIHNTRRQKVLEARRPPRQKTLKWVTSKHPQGLYIVKLLSENQVVATAKVFVKTW